MAQRCFPISMLWLKLLLQPLWEHSQLCQEWAKHCLQIGSNHRTECLTFPQHMPPDRATRTVCSLRTELCQTHYSTRRLVAVSFSGARTSIVTDCCCNSINFYQNTHSTWTSTCCVMLCSIILKTNRVPRILNTDRLDSTQELLPSVPPAKNFQMLTKERGEAGSNGQRDTMLCCIVMCMALTSYIVKKKKADLHNSFVLEVL